MSALALATLAAGQIPSQTLVWEFIGVAAVSAVLTMIKAKAESDRSPIKLGLIVGCVFGFLAVGITVIAASSM